MSLAGVFTFSLPISFPLQELLLYIQLSSILAQNGNGLFCFLKTTLKIKELLSFETLSSYQRILVQIFTSPWLRLNRNRGCLQ